MRFGCVLAAMLTLLASAPLASAQSARPAGTTARATRAAKPAVRTRPPRPATVAVRPVLAATAATAAVPTPAAPEAPPDPAAAPPAPAQLAATPLAVAPSPPAEPPLVLPHGLEALSGGAFRIAFPVDTDMLDEPAAAALGQLGRRLATRTTGRITLLAQASGPEADASAARRLSLARGLAVKAALAAGGLPPTRIDIRPLGRGTAPIDAVEVTPPAPPAPRAQTTAATP